MCLSSARKNKTNYPVLVTRQVKEGRTMAIATDSSWNWNFLRVGEGGSGRYYQKFWENVIAWMTGEPETNPIQVETDKEKYREHEKVVVHFKVNGQDYNPLPGDRGGSCIELPAKGTGTGFGKPLKPTSMEKGGSNLRRAARGFIRRR